MAAKMIAIMAAAVIANSIDAEPRSRRSRTCG
jgi:hypothetical protein